MRITIVCPEGLLAEANQLAMVLGVSHNDINTYKNLYWQSKDSGTIKLYAAASFIVSESWLDKANAELVRPVWDEELAIDMVAANKAKDVFEINQTPINAQDNKITAMMGSNGVSAINSMGVYLKK
jgi:hypothetical protein